MFVVQLVYLAFFSIALPDSMLGVAWPSMRLSFDQPLSAAGLVPMKLAKVYFARRCADADSATRSGSSPTAGVGGRGELASGNSAGG